MASVTRTPLSVPQPQQPVLNNYKTSSQISRPNTPEFKGHQGLSAEVEANEDDESAFYRDLQRQEEERQRRLAARRRIG